MTEVTLPSGAKLGVSLAPFAVSRNLYQAFLEEAKSLKISASDELDVNLFKDLFCAAASSKKIESALLECMKRCTYNGHKVTEDLFEPEEARGDYLPACVEIAMANIMPFMKTLMQSLPRLKAATENFRA